MHSRWTASTMPTTITYEERPQIGETRAYAKDELIGRIYHFSSARPAHVTAVFRGECKDFRADERGPRSQGKLKRDAARWIRDRLDAEEEGRS